MQLITLDTLETIRGGAETSGGGGVWEGVKGAAQSTWEGVRDFSGGFASGFLGRGRDGQLWGNSSSGASKAGGELGEFAGAGMGPGRMRVPRR